LPYASTPIEQTWRAHAATKRRGAEKREREAARMRAEAEELERRWLEHKAKQAEQVSA